MILELKHPTRGDIGTVTLKDGKVIETVPARCGGGSCYSPLRQMKGWIENSVRVYAAANNWTVETKAVQPGKDMGMSEGEDFDSRR